MDFRLLEVDKQLESQLGHWVRHIVGDVNLEGIRGLRLRGPSPAPQVWGRGGRRWGQ